MTEYYKNPFYPIALGGMFVGVLMMNAQPPEADYIYRLTWWEAVKPMAMFIGSFLVGIIGTVAIDLRKLLKNHRLDEGRVE